MLIIFPYPDLDHFVRFRSKKNVLLNIPFFLHFIYVRYIPTVSPVQGVDIRDIGTVYRFSWNFIQNDRTSRGNMIFDDNVSCIRGRDPSPVGVESPEVEGKVMWVCRRRGR
jgi:hypothetical protein